MCPAPTGRGDGAGQNLLPGALLRCQLAVGCHCWVDKTGIIIAHTTYSVNR